MRSLKTLFTAALALALILVFTACGEVTITYKTKEGAEFGTEKIEKGTGTVGIAAPEIKGYEFVGWLMDGEPYDCGPVNNDCVMTPVYKAEFTVTFLDPLGGQLDQRILLEGDIIEKPEDPERAECVFKGWNDVYGNPFEFDKAVENDTIAMAVWEEVPYVKTIDFPAERYTLKAGKTLQADPVINPANHIDEVAYESSDSFIFTVDQNGLIKGKNQGEAVLIVHARDVEATIPVYVK